MSRGYVDPAGVRRVASVEDLPDSSVRCYARGLRHSWGDGHYQRVTGWGPIDARAAVLTCTVCERRKSETVDASTGEILTAQYTGGVWLIAGSHFPASAARVELIRRQNEQEQSVPAIRARRNRKEAHS